MTEVLGLEHFSLSASGPTLTMSIGGGQSLAVLGPAASGKSSLLRAVVGQERAAQGSIRTRGVVTVAFGGNLSRRSKVQTLARTERATNDTASQALMATRLWEYRQSSVSELSPSQLAAAELLEVLTVRSDLALIDGLLDLLDPWALGAVLQLMREKSDTSWIVSTHRADVAARFEALIVLKDRQVRFAGSPFDLLRHGPRHELTLSTENQSGVRALVAPFEVSVRSEGDKMEMSAREGQEVAARLLLDGYGDVQMVVSRQPTLEEALLSLI